MEPLALNERLLAEIKKREIAEEKLEQLLKKGILKERRIEKILKISDTQGKQMVDLNETLTGLNKELVEAKITADSANKAKSDFLSNMSHEIRTPMNAILGFAELLDENLEDKKLKSFVKTIRSSGKTLLFLINDILDLSKIESGKLEIIKTKANVKYLLEECLQIVTLQAQQKKLKLELTLSEDVPKALLVDQFRIKEIIINLVSNALKFTDKGYIKVDVTVDKVPDSTSKIDLKIKVEDSGIGIAKSQQEKIFNIFEQTENQDVKKYGGTGLGLSICRKLAILMDGSIEVKSEEGMGSVFMVNLKNIDIVSVDEDTFSEEGFNYTSINFNHATVMVADDIKENRALIREIFSRTNINVIEAVDGKDAVQKAKNNSIDLILMDIRMPIMDGYTATRLIKKIISAPVVALTASINKDELNTLDSDRFDGYLRKPVSKNELFKELSKYLSYKNKNKIPKIKVASDEIVINDKKELQKFLGEVDNEIENIFKEARSSNDVGIIEKFAKLMLKLSSKYSIHTMIDYAQLLLEKIDMFDIDAIQLMLEQYKEKIEILKCKL